MTCCLYHNIDSIISLSHRAQVQTTDEQTPKAAGYQGGPGGCHEYAQLKDRQTGWCIRVLSVLESSNFIGLVI